MFNIEFEPSDEVRDMSDEALFNDVGDQAIKERQRRANEIWLHYHHALANAKGANSDEDRAAREIVRSEMREDMRFMLFSTEISKYNETHMDWISSIIRAEARSASRTSAETRRRMIEEARERKEREEREALESLAANPMFGMF